MNIIEKGEFIYRAIRYRYSLDTPEINYIIQNVREGDICVDIGAHKGGYLFWFHKSVGKTGKVYAFEPQVILFSYLQRIVKIFNYQNTVLENKGLSSQPGVMNFFIPFTKKGTSPGAKIVGPDEKNTNSHLKIEVTTLDAYFYERKIFPKLLKIDVEGHEKQVLRGGINLLKSCKPDIIIECENRYQDNGDIFDVFNLLIEIGYKGYFMSDQGLTSVSEFNPEIHQKPEGEKYWHKKDYINNFIFFHEL